MNKYSKIIEKIEGGVFSRKEIRSLEANAKKCLQAGDLDAQYVLAAISQSAPSDKYIIFMGFCPGADFNNRQDIEWKEKGVCTFDYIESEQQLKRFKEICPGDLIVLKKRQEIGKTMRLYGHGRVVRINHASDGSQFLEMEWSNQNDVIEVPLMGANSTVDVRAIEKVENEMPEIFEWLRQG